MCSSRSLHLPVRETSVVLLGVVGAWVGRYKFLSLLRLRRGLHPLEIGVKLLGTLRCTDLTSETDSKHFTTCPVDDVMINVMRPSVCLATVSV